VTAVVYRAGIVGCGRKAATLDDEDRCRINYSIPPDAHASAYVQIPGVTLVAASVLVYLFRSIRGRHATLLSFTVALIASGAVGNFTDRVRLGHVIDFLDVYVGTHHWPTFNLADCYISIGAALLILYSFFLEPRERKEEEAAARSR